MARFNRLRKRGRAGLPGQSTAGRLHGREVAEALPEIVETFVEEAKKGSIAHAKLLTTLGGLDKGEEVDGKKRRGKSSVGKLIEKMMREPEK